MNHVLFTDKNQNAVQTKKEVFLKTLLNSLDDIIRFQEMLTGKQRKHIDAKDLAWYRCLVSQAEEVFEEVIAKLPLKKQTILEVIARKPKQLDLDGVYENQLLFGILKGIVLHQESYSMRQIDPYLSTLRTFEESYSAIELAYSVATNDGSDLRALNRKAKKEARRAHKAGFEFGKNRFVYLVREIERFEKKQTHLLRLERLMYTKFDQSTQEIMAKRLERKKEELRVSDLEHALSAYFFGTFGLRNASQQYVSAFSTLVD